MKFPLRLIAPLLLLFLTAAPVRSDGVLNRVTIHAPAMHTTEEGVLVAEGGVEILSAEISVQAESLGYDPDTGLLFLAGPITMEEKGGGTFTGDSLILDLSDLTGGIRRGEIILNPGGLRVWGEDIRRLGKEEYSINRGVLTSCPGDCPDWSFTARRILVREEGYLTASNAAFRIAGVPVFYLPVFFYPVKTQRQTGFLLPEIKVSEELGLETSWPLFVTLGSHADLTLTPRTFSRDGLGLGAEGRYRLDYAGGGDWSGFAVGPEEDHRWFIRGDHAMSLGRRVWLRGRWYDAGDPSAPALFGESFGERHPGTALRHASIEGEWGPLGLVAGSESLLLDGALARSEIPGERLDRDRLEVHLGPLGSGALWGGLSGEGVRFQGGTQRQLVTPSVHLALPGFEGLAGSLLAKGFFAAGGEGTEEEEAYFVTLRERASAASGGTWGRHRIDLDLTFSAVEGAAFGSSTPRDGKDRIQDRKTASAAIRSRLLTGGVVWDLEVGSWRDTDLDFVMGYGKTHLRRGGFFLEGTVNRESQWVGVLPSLDLLSPSQKGWSVEGGYEGRDVEFALGKESLEGSPDLATGSFRFPFFGTEFSGEALYDLDAGKMADETVSLMVPGRCWSFTLSRLNTQERTDWRLGFDLGL